MNHLALPGLLLSVCLACSGAGSASSGAEDPSQAGSSQESEDVKPKRILTPAEIAEHATQSIVSIRTPTGLGTGFIVHERGWIVTNLHVIAGSEEAIVTLRDKTSLPVIEVLGASPRYDLVVLRVDAQALPVLELGDSEAVRPGDPVVAIGHPLGLEDTVSNGLVSAVRRVDDLVVLQISAPIAPGSSGGPLFNERGEVIGVATAILRGGQNLNLGLPAKYVVELTRDPSPIPFQTFAMAMAALREADSRIERKIPHHEVTVFRGCDEDDLKLLVHGIEGAISVGAPLYNEGNIAACFHIYEGAASDIERRLSKRCWGPKRALSQGRTRAARLDDVDAQAWAMRDAFDGLIEALERKLTNASPKKQ